MAPSELFKDLKFFIVQRVPSRLSLVQTVKDHGGTIVPLEKQADILVADHARKDVPAGDFVSWLFITESVKHGRLEDLEDRRIHRSSRGPGPAASGTAKGTRVPFSSEDDKLLRLWVARPASKEAGTSGNIIFKDLAEKNPRHTWQSWRDRWVKKLAPSADIRESPQETHGGQGVSASATVEVPEPKRDEKVVAKGTRTAFTKEDDEYLRAWILRPENGGVGTSGTKIFKELAEDNPRHTWQSWRERWVKRVSHSVEEPASTTPPPSTNQQDKSSEPAQKKGTKRIPPPRSPARTTPSKSPSPRVARSGPRPAPSTPGTRRVAVTPEPQSDLSGSGQSDTEFPPVRTEPVTQRGAAQPSSSNSHARAQFYEHFQAYRTAIDKPPVTSVTITRRPVDLWDLWSAVTRQTVDHDVRDWEDVAKELDFDWVSNPTVTHQLKKAFDLHLLKFEVLRREYLDEDQDSDDSDADDTSATAEQARAAPSPAPVFRSSPPVAGAKRTWDQTFQRGFQSSISFQSPSRKRREYDRDEVVPESPQEDTPLTAPAAPSSSEQIAASVTRPEAPRELSPQKAVPARPVEPETQDFGFIYGREDRTPSPSPSQQLQREFLSMSSRTVPLGGPSSEPSSPTSRLQVGPPRSTNTTLTSSAATREANTPKPSSAPKLGFNFEEEIDRLVSLGIDAYDVIKAYKCTNMDKHLTGMVLEAFCKHEAIPQHSGVWTTTDDAALRYIDERIIAQAPEDMVGGERKRMLRMARQRAKLVEKHGEEALDRRRQFLEDWAIPQGYEALTKAVDGGK
ncbi:hypothetical protein GQ53DRAFT_36827 [Thozetella sp. PMI_491]|nr:hypothetical protein GQ53DRAFT_36827 [Thozetella sp. PMI_491]